MSILERSVADLADALDSLESRINEKLSTAELTGDASTITSRHVRSARKNTDQAAAELSAIIGELKSLIGEKSTTS